jgi:hypothetical protein
MYARRDTYACIVVRFSMRFICAAVEGPKMAVFPGSYSDAVPFLKQPTNLDGSLPGDVGFDPLGFSEVFDIKILREAELKHGRIAMLAVLGWTVQETAPASIHPGFPTVSNHILNLNNALFPCIDFFATVRTPFDDQWSKASRAHIVRPQVVYKGNQNFSQRPGMVQDLRELA